MTDHIHPQLSYASYNNLNSWAAKTALPAELQLSERCDRLASNPLPASYTFNREYELIARYSDILPAKSSSSANSSSAATGPGPAVASSATAAFPSHNSHLLGTSSASTGGSSGVVDHTATATMHPTPAVSSSGAGISAMPAPTVGFSALPAPTATPVVRSLVDELKAKEEELTVAMMKETGKEHDVCYFFLESVNWDLKQAIDMLKSVDIR